MESNIFLLLGSNLGDARATIHAAISMIEKNVGHVLTMSSLYVTKAWGNTDQPDFLNQVIQVESDKTPELLLHDILEIEQQLGRVRTKKWGPRIIDIDVLFYGQLIINTANLSIPHPGIPSRRFTLVPLDEIATGFKHPGLHKTIKELLDACPDKSAVTKISTKL